MEKEIKDYKDKGREEINTEVNEISDLKDIYVENEICKDRNIFDLSCNKDREEEKLKKYEDSIEKEEISNKNQTEGNLKLKKKTITIILFGGIVLILLAIYAYKTVSRYEDKIFPGTSVYKEDVSNLKKEEFLSKLDKIERNIEEKKVQININNKKYGIQIKNLVSKYNNEKLYEDIIKNQNEQNILLKFIYIVSKKDTNHNLYIEIDEKSFNDFKDEIEQVVNIECVEPKVIINNDKISYEDGKAGLKLDVETLYNDIKQNISSKNLLEDNIIINAKMRKDNPKISIEDLKLINHKVSTYTTTYVSGNSRGSNVENAADKIDDLLLMPGGEFSYENTVGPVIGSNGYKYAPVISNGKLVNGIGGGVCQVSSTLYNTQLNAGILPTERRNHSKAVSYVPRGLDATLASGSIDYKFKNTYDYPLVINTKAIDGKLTIEIWSNEDALKGIQYKPVSYVSGKNANTYLYGYDKDGNKVYEKHIDTSTYR